MTHGMAWRKSSYSSASGDNCVEVAATWRKSSHSGTSGDNCVEVAAAWRKSSHSGSANDNCVEVAAAWRKSSHSSSSGDNCVEVATDRPAIAVRDSKNPAGPRLAFSPEDWRAFTHRIKQRAATLA